MSLMVLKRLSILSILFLAAACSGLAGDVEIVATFQPPPTEQPVNLAHPDGMGAAIFEARCASCHGITGAGDGAVAQTANMTVPDFTNPAVAQGQTLQDWTNTIRYGRIEKLMPPWKDSLSPEEIAAVADYTYTLWENVPVAADTQSNPAADAVAGSINGEIILQTADAAAPQTLSVGLHLLDDEQAQLSFFTQELQDTLQFSFDDIPIRSDYNYMITVRHGDSVFSSDVIKGDPAVPDMSIPVDIYEATDDPSVVEVDLLTIMLAQEGKQLVVQQFISFTNTSDRIYRITGSGDSFDYESVEITLPKNAFVLNREALTQRFLMHTENNQSRLVDTKPVIPGEVHMVEIVYTLPPVESDHLTIEFPVAYNLTKQPEILVSPGVHTIENSPFEEIGVADYNFGTFDRYVSRTIPQANDTIAFDVGIRQTATAVNALQTLASVPDIIAYALLGLGGLLVIGGGAGILMLQRRKPHIDDN